MNRPQSMLDQWPHTSAAATTPATHTTSATIARDFGEASASYDSAARLQRHMGHQLLVRLADATPGDLTDIVDLGCGTGYFTAQLQGLLPTDTGVTGVDLSPGMIDHARGQRSPAIRWLVADACQLPFADASLDLVFSNLMIQWCPDPIPVLEECLRVLRPGGHLLCSTLLDGTLRELALAWEVADPGQPHINRFEPELVLKEALRRAFPGALLQRETVVLEYPGPAALLAELKALGASFKGQGRRPTMTAPGRIRRMCEVYPRAARGGIEASYAAGYIIGRKPANSIQTDSGAR
ncbi:MULTISPECIES: malonyl-ACP O-methyltransferase BioC [Marinobacter]|nr:MULTISPECIES: malonyl-ACP O-methyltransferase BioC [Marinobacter]